MLIIVKYRGKDDSNISDIGTEKLNLPQAIFQLSRDFKTSTEEHIAAIPKAETTFQWMGDSVKSSQSYDKFLFIR